MGGVRRSRQHPALRSTPAAKGYADRRARRQLILVELRPASPRRPLSIRPAHPWERPTRGNDGRTGRCGRPRSARCARRGAGSRPFAADRAWGLRYLCEHPFAGLVIGPVSHRLGAIATCALARQDGDTSQAVADRSADPPAPPGCLGCASDAVLGVCGAALQGLFRNPLADPVDHRHFQRRRARRGHRHRGGQVARPGLPHLRRVLRRCRSAPSPAAWSPFSPFTPSAAVPPPTARSRR